MSNTDNNTTYNGWTNYETWNWSLWMDNSGQYNYTLEQAKEYLHNYEDTDSACYELSKSLQYQAEEETAELSLRASPQLDLLTSAMSNINWYEIAAHYIEMASEQAAA